jgi:hypothetical protein
MGIRFLCPNGHKLNVKADLAGKRASCPECGAKLMIPAASSEPAVAPAAAIIVDSLPPPNAVWHLRTTGGEQIGPATEAEFCSWIAAGRVTADAHVWRDGWTEWKLARDAADALPMPLAAMPVAAPPIASAPIVAVPPPPQPIDLVTESDLDLAAAEPVASKVIVTDPALLAASTYALQQRRRKQAQLTLAIVMLVAVIVLAVVLVWVVRINTSVAPQTSRSNYPHFFSASAANC